jgi:hypothetical protein
MIKIDNINSKESLDNVVSVLLLEKKNEPYIVLMDDEVLLRLGSVGVFTYIAGILIIIKILGSKRFNKN